MSRALFASLTVAVFAVAGCGKSSTVIPAATATTAPASSVPGQTVPTGTSGTTSQPRRRIKPLIYTIRSTTYKVKLTGMPRAYLGSTRSGLAVISINAAKSELCWTFSQLKNVTAPTEGTITSATLLTHLFERRYEASGCVPHEPPTLLKLIEREPQNYHVNLVDAAHRERGVTGQL